MSLIIRMRKQTAVYWAVSGMDQYGKRSYSDPVEILVRWEVKNVEFLNSKGEIQLSNAVVYVGEDIELKGVLMLGGLINITDETNIKENNGAWEVNGFSKIPNLRNTEYLRTVYL